MFENESPQILDDYKYCIVNLLAMEDKLFDELLTSYKCDGFADWLKVSVEKIGDMATAEKIIDNYSFRHSESQIPGSVGFCDNYWSKVKKEFDKLVCGHSQYAKESEDYYVFGKFFSLTTVSAMASSMAPIVSIPSYILTPTIVLMLHSMMKMGRNAYCSTVDI